MPSFGPVTKMLLGTGAAAATLGAAAPRAHAATQATDWGKPLYSDEARTSVHGFMHAADHWGAGRDPREMIKEYANHGSAVSAAEIGGFGIKDLRQVSHSLPGSKPWDPSYASHYDEFARGPLNGYLTRSHEYENEYNFANKDTGIPGLLAPVRQHGFAPTEAQLLQHFPAGQGTAYPAPWAGDPSREALFRSSYRDLLEDTGGLVAAGHATLPSDAPRGITEHVRGHAGQVSTGLGYGPDINALSPSQQADVLRHLDRHLHTADPQTYVTKQFMDFEMGRDVPRAGAAYSVVGDVGSPIVETANAVHHAGTSVTEGVAHLAPHHDELLAGGLGGLAVGAGLHALNRFRQPKTADWRHVGLWGAGMATGSLAGALLGDVAADKAVSLAPGTLNPEYAEVAGRSLGAAVGGNLSGYAATALLNPHRQRNLTVSNLPAIAAGLPVGAGLRPL